MRGETLSSGGPIEECNDRSRLHEETPRESERECLWLAVKTRTLGPLWLREEGRDRGRSTPIPRRYWAFSFGT
ncbi:hypothetical protein WN55_06434 [Dufourea novaeangliae]|uniref:Uncharacterized protein n=1 Tax=Dufourea novaeangliae TaxID=178035 RepID=A0A154P2A2_DUFNO|nr:hypothetical protein WN55_06434 [Dufourea novaeangliae]